MTTITETTKMSDVEKAKTRLRFLKAKTTIKLITNVALCDYFKRKVDKLTLKEVAFSVDLDQQKKLYDARDTLVDAYEEQCIPEIIAKCVEQHNRIIDAKIAEKERIAAEKQAKADALTETEIANLFNDYLQQNVNEDINYRDLSCSLDVFATISDNSDAISFFKYHLSEHHNDNRVTYYMLRDYLDAIDVDNAVELLENKVQELRDDLSRAIRLKDWEDVEYIKERISDIENRI